MAEGSRMRMTVRGAESTRAYDWDMPTFLPYAILGLVVVPPVLALLVGAWYWLRGERHGVRGHPGTESN